VWYDMYDCCQQAFWSIKIALKHSQKINDQWNRSKKVELKELKRNEAIIRLHWTPGMKTSKHICQYNQGVYTYLPLIWGGSRFTFKEKCCHFDGAPYCEYHLKWPLRNRFREIISRFFTSQSVLKDIIKEIEEDKKIISQKNDELMSINKELQKILSEYRQSEEALKKSEEKYRILFDLESDALALIDIETGNMLEINNAFIELYGYSREEILKMKNMDFSAEPEKTRQATEERGPYIPLRYHKKKDGSVFPTEITASILKYKGRDVQIAAIRDITERKRLENQLRQAHKMEAIATLAGGIAHQFNNTLTPIKANIEFLEMETSVDENIAKYTEPMKDSTQRMIQLTDQLLAYARGGKYQDEIFLPNDFIKNTIALIKHTLPAAIDVETDLSNDVWSIKADLTQMQMVFTAVLQNASEAIKNKGRIKISTQNKTIDESFVEKNSGTRLGSYVSFTVSDDGKGMDEKTRKRVFEPFFTTKFHGRGLGLAAAYGIVKNHDGWITIDSKLGKGSIVRILIPAIIEKPTEVKKPRTEPSKGVSTILVIEDEESVMNVNRKILERFGYRVLEARTGREAVDIAKTFDGQIDLTLLDIILPDMEGKEVYPLLMEVRPNMKVIVCSGYSADGPAKEILDAGAHGFIQKPFSLADMSEKLKNVLEGK